MREHHNSIILGVVVKFTVRAFKLPRRGVRQVSQLTALVPQTEHAWWRPEGRRQWRRNSPSASRHSSRARSHRDWLSHAGLSREIRMLVGLLGERDFFAAPICSMQFRRFGKVMAEMLIFLRFSRICAGAEPTTPACPPSTEGEEVDRDVRPRGNRRHTKPGM
jgi:hypothetical protein